MTSPLKGEPISQRSVVRMIHAFNELGCFDPNMYTEVGPLVSAKELWRELFARDFRRDFLDVCATRFGWKFDKILPMLHDGSFFEKHDVFKDILFGDDHMAAGRRVLIDLAEYLFEKSKEFSADLDWQSLIPPLKRSLELDGFRLVDGRLVRADTAIFDQPKQVSLLEHQIRTSGVQSEDILLRHFKDGEKQFIDRNFDLAVVAWRKFFEQLLRDIAVATAKHRADLTKDPSNMNNKDLHSYLMECGFFVSDERTAFGSTWGFLSAGGHPGVLEEETAYLAMVLSLSFGRVALSKFKSWKVHGYRTFV